MKKFFLIIIFMMFAVTSQAQILSKTDKEEILKVLEAQRVAWNEGALEKYMQGYWNSDSLRFIGKSGVRFGWDETLESYKKGYPTKDEMGNLVFEVISLEGISESTAFMIGKWSLIRKENNVFGHFSLIWKKIKGKWLITSDHSS
ncbi:MAG: nuclear transport factor 2 family protein [Melioribacteraceae bacterium]